MSKKFSPDFKAEINVLRAAHSALSIKVFHKHMLSEHPDVLFKHEVDNISYSALLMMLNPEYEQRTREYSQRPEVKQRRREYKREYSQRPEVKQREREYYQRPKLDIVDAVLTLFDKEACSVEYLRGRFLEEYNIRVQPSEIESAIQRLQERLGPNSPIVDAKEPSRNETLYKLNHASPYWRVCDGFARSME